MKNINTFGLDSLIAVYFGQDYDMFGSGESVDAQIDAWIAETPDAFRHGLIGDIDQFYRECDNLEEDFEARYGFDFSPELWGTTPTDFLRLLREKVIHSLE
ncbi:contact-dependent growth inhibition system immunity protein [Pantoea sp. MBD-2R]|uniref:contact-dependent growth inhibition system immunity protein n=1 Tax=unclassified Pantoea TaxID=2630326 RepID=UPI0011BF5C02|nr:contact-dependent growth inhibition system immunity protein [Pantoea sp. CCBC3-3-1]